MKLALALSLLLAAALPAQTNPWLPFNVATPYGVGVEPVVWNGRHALILYNTSAAFHSLSNRVATFWDPVVYPSLVPVALDMHALALFSPHPCTYGEPTRMYDLGGLLWTGTGNAAASIFSLATPVALQWPARLGVVRFWGPELRYAGTAQLLTCPFGMPASAPGFAVLVTPRLL